MYTFYRKQNKKAKKQKDRKIKIKNDCVPLFYCEVLFYILKGKINQNKNNG